MQSFKIPELGTIALNTDKRVSIVSDIANTLNFEETQKNSKHHQNTHCNIAVMSKILKVKPCIIFCFVEISNIHNIKHYHQNYPTYTNLKY